MASKKKMGPVVGITGFKTREQTQMMADWWEWRNPQIPHKLGVGVMMSRRTLLGEKSDYSKVFPPSAKVSEIFIRRPYLLNNLHYADFEGNGIKIEENLSRAIEVAGEALDAVQLDMVWPNPVKVMEGVRRSQIRPKLILQIGERAFEQVDNNPYNLVQKLSEGYFEVFDGILLDRSVGRGKKMDPDFLLPFVREISENLSDLAIIVAGGLGPKTAWLAEPLIKKYPWLGTDAEGRLRRNHKNLKSCPKEPVHWKFTVEYVNKTCRMLELSQPREAPSREDCCTPPRERG